MKKLALLLTILISLLIPSTSQALIHAYKGLTGGANANLDGIPVANISNGEVATGADTSNIWRWYYYNASNDNTSNPESSPNVIVPDDNASGTGAWILISGIATSASATPGWTFEDNSSPYEIDIYGTAGGNDTTLNLGVEISGNNTDIFSLDGPDGVAKFHKPFSGAKRTVDIDNSAAEITLTTEMGSNVEDWNGVRYIITDDAYDVIIPGCNTSNSPNKYDAQIEICQSAANDTVSLVSAEANDSFLIRDGTFLTAGYELDSPGAAQRHMCVNLACAPAASDGVWIVMNETGGTSTVDPTWVTGGAAD